MACPPRTNMPRASLPPDATTVYPNSELAPRTHLHSFANSSRIRCKRSFGDFRLCRYARLGKTAQTCPCWDRRVAVGDPAYWGKTTGPTARLPWTRRSITASPSSIPPRATATVSRNACSGRCSQAPEGCTRRHQGVAEHCAPDQIRAACEASLERLGTDCIDLYQIHWPNREVPFADTCAELEKLKDEGKIRYVGVSNFGSRSRGLARNGDRSHRPTRVQHALPGYRIRRGKILP